MRFGAILLSPFNEAISKVTFFVVICEPELSMGISRRRFLLAGLASVGVGLSGYAVYRMGKYVQPMEPPKMSEVYITEASDRVSGIRRLIGKFDSASFKGHKSGSQSELQQC